MGLTGSSKSSITLQPGSTRFVCALTGHNETRTTNIWGLAAADLGYSVRYQGDTWFLFGDAGPAGEYPLNDEHRYPFDQSGDPQSYVNDAIGYARDVGANGCPRLKLVAQSPTLNAYANPYLYLNGQEVSLRTNEQPVSGITVGGKLYVLFMTNNPTPTNTPTVCIGQPIGCLGYSYSTVMGVLDPKPGMPLNFDGLYTLSGPQPGWVPYSQLPGKFVNVALASVGAWIYMWGTTGGPPHGPTACYPGLTECFRRSNVYLARMMASAIGQQPASGRPAGVQYWAAGKWVGDDESAATPLFHQSAPCMGELGVQYNPYVRSWVMLYNCASAAVPGILMRTAQSPAGPWSAPQTIFRIANGYCKFIAHPTCPPGPLNGDKGSAYGPYFIAGRTTGVTGTMTTQATSTFYYTLDTFQPYGQVILTSTILGPPPPHKLPPPPCAPKPCM